MLSQHSVSKHISGGKKKKLWTTSSDHYVIEGICLYEYGRWTLSTCNEDGDCGCGNIISSQQINCCKWRVTCDQLVGHVCFICWLWRWQCVTEFVCIIVLKSEFDLLFHKSRVRGVVLTWQMRIKRGSSPCRRCPSSTRPSAHNQVAPIRPMNHVEFATCGFAMAILEDARLATRGRCAEAAWDRLRITCADLTMGNFRKQWSPF